MRLGIAFPATRRNDDGNVFLQCLLYCSKYRGVEIACAQCLNHDGLRTRRDAVIDCVRICADINRDNVNFW